jgi:hypothetical protein
VEKNESKTVELKKLGLLFTGQRMDFYEWLFMEAR